MVQDRGKGDAATEYIHQQQIKKTDSGKIQTDEAAQTQREAGRNCPKDQPHHQRDYQLL